MFATAHGTVRRNSMDAFTNIPTAGKIAMRFGIRPAEANRRSDDSDEQAIRPTA
jgi:DNA gyrase subunit A